MCGLLLPAIERDVVEIGVGPTHRRAEGDRVQGLQIHVGRPLSKADLAEPREGQRIELPVQRQRDDDLPAVLAALVAAGRRRIARAPAELAALVAGGARAAATGLSVDAHVCVPLPPAAAPAPPAPP